MAAGDCYNHSLRRYRGFPADLVAYYNHYRGDTVVDGRCTGKVAAAGVPDFAGGGNTQAAAATTAVSTVI